MGFARTRSRSSGSLATFTSRTILPVSSTMQMLVSLTDMSSPAQCRQHECSRGLDGVRAFYSGRQQFDARQAQRPMQRCGRTAISARRPSSENISLAACSLHGRMNSTPPSAWLSPRQREDNTAAHLRHRHAAAVAQNDDADLSFRYQSDLGRGVVHPAVLVDDRFVALANLPGKRLVYAISGRKRCLLRSPHRLLERRLIRQFAKIGGQEHGHVASGRIHLTGFEPAVITLEISGRADQRAILRISLHCAAREGLWNLTAGI